MDQNPNDNLFFSNEPPKQPEQPRQPEPFSTGEPPAPASSGAQVYPPTPGFEAPGPQSFTPPPPPPPMPGYEQPVQQIYTPPAAQPPKSNRTIWIIVIVVVLLLCCCCLGLALWYAWNNGDQWIEDYSSILPMIQPYLA